MSEERSSNLQRFSGDDDDAGKALKKWKAWVLARMITVKDLSKEQRGPWLFTLLDGRALEACEHLTLEQGWWRQDHLDSARGLLSRRRSTTRWERHSEKFSPLRMAKR